MTFLYPSRRVAASLQQQLASRATTTTTTTTRFGMAAASKGSLLSCLSLSSSCPSHSRRWLASAASVTTPTQKRQASPAAATTTSAAKPAKHAMLSLATDNRQKVIAPPMVYIAGEEMTRYACQLMLKEWIEPYFDIHSTWQYFDLSCQHRDATNDQVLHDAVKAGAACGAIFKEPTITPSALQVQQMNLSRALPSPNGAMRRGWNGITISRDTIHIDGIQLGYKRPVLFERHAVGGEYGAGWNSVGQGTLLTTYLPKDDARPPFVVDKRDLHDDHNVVVVYHNPYDNVQDLAHLFFTRALAAHVTPYIVTKKTVFKWQEGFWQTMKTIFDEHYKDAFVQAGLMEKCGPNRDLQHLISDAATMQLIRWTDGGFAMAAHNYDGDMLTDQIAQVHRSPGFITSNLVGKCSVTGRLIKEFEASHGTVSDLWHDHLAGKETSLNPLGLIEALMGAMQHAAALQVEKHSNNNSPPELLQQHQQVQDQVSNFTTTLRTAIHNTFRYGQGTRDMSGPAGYTTEDFIAKVAWRLHRYLLQQEEESPPPVLHHEPDRKYRRNYDIDEEAVNALFAQYDVDADGYIDFEEFTRMLVKMNLAPKRSSSSGSRTFKTTTSEKEPDV